MSTQILCWFLNFGGCLKLTLCFLWSQGTSKWAPSALRIGLFGSQSLKWLCGSNLSLLRDFRGPPPRHFKEGPVPRKVFTAWVCLSFSYPFQYFLSCLIHSSLYISFWIFLRGTSSVWSCLFSASRGERETKGLLVLHLFLQFLNYLPHES